MREKSVASYLFNRVRDKGGMCIKLSAFAITGMPDRLILMRGGKIKFAETKAPGKELRAPQLRMAKRLKYLGFEVWKIDSYELADVFLNSFDK